MGYSGAEGKLIDEKKNQKQKISWHCPFKDTLLTLLSQLWIEWNLLEFCIPSDEWQM
jgi:hypothetical protein